MFIPELLHLSQSAFILGIYSRVVHIKINIEQVLQTVLSSWNTVLLDVYIRKHDGPVLHKAQKAQQLLYSFVLKGRPFAF